MTAYRLGARYLLGTLVVIAVGIAGVWCAWARSPGPEPTLPPADTISSRATPSAWQGATSCAAAACHNANGPAGSAGSEYSTWATRDPHRKAYGVLFDPRSERIAAYLKRGKKASEDSLCLNCHVHPAEASDTEFLTRDEGVGCESCHGAAGQWRTTHYLADWRLKSNAEKQKLKMVPTKDLVVRARLCAGCHVGEGVRDVNHDLIAAGHPRLNFEFGAFHAVLPKHWDEQAEKTRYPDFEARAWALGQVVSAQVALELLADRARNKAKPWPEFSEYNCFACHHDLLGESWRQQQAKAGDRLGLLPWSTWYTAMLTRALSLPGADDRPQLSTALKEIDQLMSRRSPPRDQVVRQAEVAACQLDQAVRRLARGSYSNPELLHNEFKRIALEDGKLAEGSWDRAAQLYLALAALYHAQGDLDPRQRDPQLKRDLENLAGALDFPQSPTLKYNSPREGDHADEALRFRQALGQIQKLVNH